MAPWLLWTITTMVSWGLWGVATKLLGTALSGEQIQALSTLGLIPILLPLALHKNASLKGASHKGLALAFLGGVITCLGNIPFFHAVAKGGDFAKVVSLTAMALLVTVIMALVLLRERINRMQMLGLALSMVALWLFRVEEDKALLSKAVLVALLPILLWGASGFLQKLATNYVTAEAAALVYLVAFVPVGLVYGFLEPWPANLAPNAWYLVILAGFLLAFGNFAVIQAYGRSGKAAIIAPLVNLYPLVSITAAIQLGDLFPQLEEKIPLRHAIGIACALASAAALAMESTPAKSHAETNH